MHMKSTKGIVNFIKRAKKSDDSGVAMITAMIIGVVVMVFCLLLLMVTYILYEQSIKKVDDTQCRLIAQTCMESVRSEIVDSESDVHKYLADQMSNGTWISIEKALVDTDENAISELVLNMVDHTVDQELALYDIQTIISYSITQGSDDDGSPEVPDDNDIYDESGSGNGSSNGGGSSGSGQNYNGNGNVAVYIKVIVIKGPKDSPMSYCSYETECPAVTF